MEHVSLHSGGRFLGEILAVAAHLSSLFSLTQSSDEADVQSPPVDDGDELILSLGGRFPRPAHRASLARQACTVGLRL